MTVEVTPRPAGSEPPRPGTRKAKHPVDSETAKRFATLVEGRPAAETKPPRTLLRRASFDLSNETEAAPMAEQPPYRPIGERKSSQDQAAGADSRIVRIETSITAGEPVTLSGGNAADPAHAAIADRMATPDRADAETLLTMPDSRWLAREAAIFTQPGGALTLSLDLNAGEEESNAAADELRRRLEARGLGIAEIRVLDDRDQFAGSK